MSKFENLLTQAAVIRDATEEHENTAVRVGTMFVDFIQSCMAVLPAEAVDASGISTSASKTNFVVSYRTVDGDGANSTRTITIPAASGENAGLLTPSQLSVMNDVTSQLSGILSRIALKADTADVDAALALKADKSEVETALGKKANAADVADLRTDLASGWNYREGVNLNSTAGSLGKTIADDGTCLTPFIHVAKDDVVTWHGGSPDGTCWLALYDADFNCINSSLYKCNEVPRDIVVTNDVVAYVRASFVRGFASRAYIAVNGTTVWSPERSTAYAFAPTLRHAGELVGAGLLRSTMGFDHLTPMVSYNVTLSEPLDTADVNTAAGNDVFAILWVNETKTGYLARVQKRDEATLKQSYTVTLPADASSIVVRARHAVGQRVTVTLSEGAAVSPEGAAVTPEGLTLTNGYGDNATNDIVVSATHVITSPIEGGRGFFLEVNDGYRVHQINLCDARGEIIAVNWLAGTIYSTPMRTIWGDALPDWHSRTIAASDIILPQHTIRVVMCKEDTANEPTRAIAPNEPIIKRFVYLDNPRLHRQRVDAPYFAAAQHRLRLLTSPLWVPLQNFPPSGGSSSICATSQADAFFLEGRWRNGIPYSENDIFSKYVGQHVSIYTFLTALLNRRSVMYTERVSGSYARSAYGINYRATLRGGSRHENSATLSMPFYGTVCSGLTGFVAGLRNIYLSSKYGTNTLDGHALTTIVDATSGVAPDDAFDLVQPLDFIWNDGHISIVSDIIVDDRGVRRFVVWAEQNMPTAFVTPYTREIFQARLAAKQCRVKRWAGWSQLTAAETLPFVQTDFFDLPTPLPVETTEVMTMYGDKPCLAVGDPLHLNCRRGSADETLYDTVEVYTEAGALISSINIGDTTTYPSHNPRLGYTTSSNVYVSDGEDWVDFDCATLSLPAGKYKARLAHSETGATTGYTRWELIDIAFNAVIDGTTAVVSNIAVMGAKQDTPMVLRAETINGYGAVPTYVPFGSTDATVTSDTGYRVIKLEVSGDYGVANKWIDLT